MNTTTRHRRAAVALGVLAGSAGLAIVPATPALAVVTGNACYNSATAQIAPVEADLVGTLPATVSPGETVTATGLKATLSLPGTVFVTGYNLGLVKNGSTIDGTVKARIDASNTVEGQKDTNLAAARIGPITISDPDGAPGSGDETAPPVTFTVPFDNLSWTAGNSGQVTLREASVPISNASAGGGLSVDANLGFIVKFRCSPGTVDTVANTAAFGPGAVFGTTRIVTPAAAPVAANDSGSVGANQAASINVVSNDSDANGDLAPGTVTIVDAPTSGTAVANPDGTVTYTNNKAAASDVFTYTVKDAGGLVSNKASVNISILGDACDASGASCGLDQVVEIDVTGAGMTMKQEGPLVKLAGITLNGKPQKSTGVLKGLTVVNARGTDLGWSLTGRMTSDFSDGKGDGTCPAGDKTTWDNHCIPGGNVGWGPSAAVAHEVIPGDVATVVAGTPQLAGGLDTTKTLCSAPAKQSGGTFTCGGAIGLGIPASTAAGKYQATLTLTLV